MWKNLLIFNNFSFAFLFSGECSNKECQYLHIDPESKIKDCPWYDRGFCKHGGLIEQAILDIRELKKQRREGLQLSTIDHNTDVHCMCLGHLASNAWSLQENIACLAANQGRRTIVAI